MGGNLNKLWLLAGVLVLFLLLVSEGVASPSAFRIHMESWSPYFSPDIAMVVEGALIRWDNPTGTHHTITHDGCRGGGFCAFESSPIPPSGIFEVSGLPTGTFSYHCSLHPIMRGVVHVVAGHTSEI